VLPLPAPLDARLPAPDAASLTRLDALLERLTVNDVAARLRARAELTRIDEEWLPALAVRLETIADQADKLAMKATLAELRERAPLPLPGDTLELVLRAERPADRAYEALAHVLALSRMLEHLGSAAAGKQLIRVYVRFGEFLRVDTERALERLGERALAPLIETTRHPAPQIVTWAEERLVAMGKALPGDAVQVENSDVLADVLRAYGRTRRLDTAKLFISFAASERAPVRRAAREALTLLGAAGSWQLRDGYEKAMGKRAPEEWSWERTARELFAELDRQRLLDLYALFDSGRAALDKGELDTACDVFDRVLAIDPSFEPGPVMPEAYLAYTRRYADERPERARLASSRAARLSEGTLHAQATSLLAALDAEALLTRGIVDQVLVRRASTDDPTNERARALLPLIDPDASPPSAWQRYRVVALISLLGAAASVALTLRHRRRDARTNPPAAEPPALGGD
jgi:tetratricopeptide (TPR) repeat protein